MRRNILKFEHILAFRKMKKFLCCYAGNEEGNSERMFDFIIYGPTSIILRQAIYHVDDKSEILCADSFDVAC